MKLCVKHLITLLALFLMPFGAKAQQDTQIPWTDLQTFYYGIWIGDWDEEIGDFRATYISTLNADNVFGDGTVSYANGTLTLNGATINGCIYSNNDLTIELIGDNFISAVDTCAIYCVAESTKQLTLQGTGRLTMEGGPCIMNYTPTLNDGLQYLIGGTNQSFTVIGTQLFSGGTGVSDDQPHVVTDSDDPYIISSAGELKLLSKCVNHGQLTTNYFKLADDIDCTGMSGFEPIGTYTYPFEGLFDGDNHTITNLNCTTNANQAYAGLFGRIEGYNGIRGIIIYINMEGCAFEGGEHTGAIAGYLQNGEIWNCHILDCSIRSGNYQKVNVGGIVGTIENSSVHNSRTIGHGENETEGTKIYAITSSTASSGTAKAGGLVGNILIVNDGYAINGSTVDGNVFIKSSHAGSGSVVASGGLYGGATRSLGSAGGKPRVDWNNVWAKSISSESEQDNATVYAGAIAGQTIKLPSELGGTSTTENLIDLVGNLYGYDVMTLTKKGSGEAVLKSGYTQRGLGDGADDFVNNGAALRTYKLTLPASDADATYEPIDGTYYRADGNDIYAFQNKSVQVVVTPQKSNYVPTDVKVTYTDNNKVKTIIPSKTKANNSYTCSFMMPYGDAVFNADIVYNKTYNLWIGATQVCEENRNDILGDGSQWSAASFTYNPQNNNLIVSDKYGHSIMSQIDEGLTVYLAPKKEILLSNIIYNGNKNAPLTITTDGNNPGRLTLNNMVGNNLETAATPVISGFSQLILDEKRNLAILNPEGIVYQNKKMDVNSAVIGVPMMPITKETYIQPDGDKIVPETGESDINKVVDNILYTLRETAKPDGDGFDDGGYIVINTVTSDQKAAEAAKNYTPGTEDFMDHLKGMTFLLPAGNGKIKLDVQTMDAHVLKVKVGDAVPTSFKKTSRGEIEIPYNVGKPTYVYLYNGGPGSASARSKAIYKGGKKTVTHIRVYKIGSNPSNVNSSNPVGEASGGEYSGYTGDLEGQDVMSDEEIEAAMGDVDGDGKQTANDIVEMVKAIMGKHTGVYNDIFADMDGDGVITISDIIMIINKM